LQSFEYKYVLRNETPDTPAVWEDVQNRSVLLEPKAKTTIARFVDTWEKEEHDSFSLSPKVATDSVAVVVLGKKLLGDGKASPTLQNRIAFGSEIFLRESLKHPKSIMIVTGGVVQRGDPNSPYQSEAEVMRTLAVQNFVPKSCVVLENKSMNTIENAINTRDVLEDLGITKVVLVTSDYHMPRSKRIFETVLSDRGKSRDYSIQTAEERPPISQEEKRQEMVTEQKMMGLLDEDLLFYQQR